MRLIGETSTGTSGVRCGTPGTFGGDSPRVDGGRVLRVNPEFPWTLRSEPRGGGLGPSRCW